MPLHFVVAQDKFAETEFTEEGEPKILDPSLKISKIAEGLKTPTTMAFIGKYDILVLEKDTGEPGQQIDIPVERQTKTGRRLLLRRRLMGKEDMNVVTPCQLAEERRVVLNRV